MELNKKISESKFIVGGAAILHLQRTKQKTLKEGNKTKRPLIKINLREWNISYNILTKQNRPEEAKPWEININNPPPHPNTLPLQKAPKTKPICPTDA